MHKFKIGDKVRKYNMYTKRYSTWYIVGTHPANKNGDVKYDLSKVKGGGASWTGYGFEIDHKM